MLRSRYKANSRYVSIEAYPFVLPCGERNEGEHIDACSRASGFCLVSCAANGGTTSSRSGERAA